MGDTSIEWTDHSINPIRARLRDAAHAGLTKGGYGAGVGHYCEKISPGCALCYASTSQARFGMPAFPGVQKVAPSAAEVGLATVAVNEKVEVFFDDSRVQEVLSRKKPTKYFWCDQTDLFGRWVPDDWIDRCFAVMALTPWHTHQVLTKRAERMAGYCSSLVEASRLRNQNHLAAREHFDFLLHGMPKNVWLGVSVEDQPRADERIPHLLKCPATVRFLSVEPLLGAVDLANVRHSDGEHVTDALNGETVYLPSTCIDQAVGIDWVIVGGESGPRARPCDLKWIHDIVMQCGDAGVPVFVKQVGSKPENSDFALRCGDVQDRKGGDMAEWPEALRVREFPAICKGPASEERSRRA